MIWLIWSTSDFLNRMAAPTGRTDQQALPNGTCLLLSVDLSRLCCKEIICTLALSLLRVRLKYLLLLPTAYMRLQLEQELPVCDSTLNTRNKIKPVGGQCVQMSLENFYLCSTLWVNQGETVRVLLSAFHHDTVVQVNWFHEPDAEYERENSEAEDNAQQHRSLMTQICSALPMY